MGETVIIQQGSIEALIQKHLKITWNIIGFCNFRCPYCLDMNGKKTINIVSEKKIQYAINNIFSLNYNSYEFFLLGGEPTLFPKIIFLISELLKCDKVKRIYVMTNGSNDIFKKILDPRLMIIVSLHPLSISQLQIQKRENVFFNLLAYPKTFPVVQEIFNKYPVDEITVVRKPPDFVNIFEYSDFQKDWVIQNDPNKIKPQNLFHGIWRFEDGTEIEQPKYSMMEFNQKKYLNFQDMYCMNNALNIQPDGYYKYACYDSKLSRYSIFEKPIIYQPNILKCKYHFCNCAGRLNVLKFRDINDALKYQKYI